MEVQEYRPLRLLPHHEAVEEVKRYILRVLEGARGTEVVFHSRDYERVKGVKLSTADRTVFITIMRRITQLAGGMVDRRTHVVMFRIPRKRLVEILEEGLV